MNIRKEQPQEKELFERTSEWKYYRLKERRKKRRQRMCLHIAVCCSVMVIFFSISAVALKAYSDVESTQVNNIEEIVKRTEKPSNYREDFLTINEYSRPAIPLEQINGIVVHYTGNPGTTAAQNRSYFEGLAESKSTKASSHYIIGLGGEIIQCIPLDEIAYASKERNTDTISIECCIDNEIGKFNGKTYDALVELTAWLIGQYQLDIDSVIRHYDVTGKNCPKYFVENESAWEDFKLDVTAYIENYGK